MKIIDLDKKGYETFGLQMIGGNNIGIYVRGVDNWKPAERCGIREGWRLLKVYNRYY